MSLVLGVDLGTSAVKVAAVKLNESAELLAEGSADFPTSSALPNQAEQSPADWLDATRQAMQALGAKLHPLDPAWPEHVVAIGLTGQLPTLVCMGERGPLAPAITWKDGRADAWAAEQLSGLRGEHYARTGMPIDGRYLAPMFQFHFGRRKNEVRTVLSAKDYLLHALTGVSLTEPSTAAGYGVYDLNEQRFATDLCAFWHLPERVLPQIRPANTPAGALSHAGAGILGLPAGIPVSTGAADSVSASYAMAGLDERIVSISFGSSAVILGACATPLRDRKARYLVTPHVESAWYGREMDLLSAGTGYRWLSSLLGWQDGDIDRQAAAAPAGANGLFFTPYLAGGEQGALWNPRLRGAIFGLSLNHAHADLARAYLEGVFFEIKRCVDVLAESTPIESVRVGGKIVRFASSMQMLADILGIRLEEASAGSPAAVGAALQSARLASVRTAALCVVPRPVRSVVPSAPMVERYRSIYPEYLARAARCE